MKYSSTIIVIIILLFGYTYFNNKLTKYQKVLTNEIKEVAPKKIYLIKNEDYDFNIDLNNIDINEKNIKWYSNNKKILKVENNNTLIGLKKGKTKIYTYILNKKYEVEVEITNLLLSQKDEYNINKKFLECNMYNKEENDLIDKILENKINNAGYKTRAGVVEAARFLTLNLPYKINYFYENGRGTTFGIQENVQGEGRYYNKGLFLDESRFENIIYKKNGPATWGCNLYSNVIKEEQKNGLDCSGFISWAMIQAGFDPGDIGAGITDVYDYTDTGEKTNLTDEVINKDIIKTGDLLHSNRAGGHIAIIVGMDEYNYYVAEAIWYEPNGVVINTYSKENIKNNFNYVILMDSFYKNDGKYSELWY